MPYEIDLPNLAQRARLNLAAYKDKSLAPVWGCLAALLVAVAWLLPNHHQPWLAFHSDAWMAVALTMVAAVVVIKTRRLTLSALDLVLAFTAAIPLIHFTLGLLPFAGRAWVLSAYLLGLLLAVLVGRQWQAWRPIWMGNIVFGSFFVASLVSVGLQLYQWTGMADDRGMQDIWVFGMAQNRPYANLGQPNQMATLLLWGLLACGWGRYRGYVGRAVTLLAATAMILGLALTQSRTGFLGLCAIVAAAWWWRAIWADPKTPLYVSALIPLYALVSFAIDWASVALLLDQPNSMMSRTLSEVRPALWAMLVDAAWQRPWLGYGWNEVLTAQLAVAERHPNVPTLFGHAHNLALDLVVWAGIPLGLGLAAICIAWTGIAARRVAQPAQVLYFLVLLTIGLHAMLELPLHYAYFLLPTGLVVGALSGDLKIWLLGPASQAAWRAACLLLIATSLLLGLIIRDYFAVEAYATDVRMKLANFRSEVPVRPPELAVLTQFLTLLDISLLEPAMGRSAQDLQRARDLTVSVVNYRNLSHLPLVLALNGHVPEARCWMSKATVLVAPASRPLLIDDWREFQATYPQLRSVRWPESSESTSACDAVRQSRLGPWSQLRW